MRKLQFVFFILTVIVSGLSAKSYAQLDIGISAGYTHTSIESSTQYYTMTQYKSEGGFGVAVPVLYHFNDWFALQADPSFIQRNYTYGRTGVLSDLSELRQNNYISLPVMAHFSFGGKRLRGYTNLGAYVGYWASGRVSGNIDRMFFPENETPLVSYDDPYVFNKKRDNRFEAGLVAGIGIEFQASELVRIFAEGRYCYGLTDMQKQYMTNQTPRYNSTTSITVGCLFRILK